MKQKAEKQKSPGQTGGTLIRKLIKLLKNSGIPYPFSQPIFLAFSGGTDSLALAALLSRYGKKVINDPNLLTLLYLEHGWKSRAETLRAQHKLKNLANKLKLKLQIETLQPRNTYPSKASPEAYARALRKEVFSRVSTSGAIILTAHHADDLAETLVWRIFTGTLENSSEGIRVLHEGVLRPLLSSRKKELVQFLTEEKLTPVEDPANEETSYLRVKIRKRLMTQIESIFPRAIDHLMQMGLDAQSKTQKNGGKPGNLVGEVGRSLDIQLRKSHYDSIQILVSKSIGQLSLPGGWTLSWKKEAEELKLSRLKS